MTQTVDFMGVFRSELGAIRKRHNKHHSKKIAEDTSSTEPSTALELTGITCSGGGIRSASFCLGVLQGLQYDNNTLDRMDYLSTVSGGGYIGTTLTIGMSLHGQFPFGRLDQGSHETPEVRHLRDNSRYLLQNGLPSLVTAIVIYLRGILMNVLTVLPLLLGAAAVLLWLNPDTDELAKNRFLWTDLTGSFGNSRIPFSIAIGLLVAGLLGVYAVWVSLSRIKPISERQLGAIIAGSIFVLAMLGILLELHTLVLRLAFESQGVIKAPGATASDSGKFLADLFKRVKDFAIYLSPVVLPILPFLKGLISKATTGESTSWSGLAGKLASRAILLFAASVVPVLLWLATMQLAYWGTRYSDCPKVGVVLDATGSGCWSQAPGFLQDYFIATAHYHGAFLSYAIAAFICFLFWSILSVNSNSLHQLYRDRLGQAFLIKRKSGSRSDEIDYADTFKLSDIDPDRGPYHLINTALNVPGSKFANRRGRNADFFLLSHGYVGSEATQYVDTKSAEAIVDGLNIGTAMALSGAAAAPNMGMASIRPLALTIALLNVRLGRWLRHPEDIVYRKKKLDEAEVRAEARQAAHEKARPWLKDWYEQEARKKAAAIANGEEPDRPGEHPFRRIPRPLHLLREAFSKTGKSVERPDPKRLSHQRGFVFLTDGGHIDNLGIYELLRRRCKLIIAIDGEADPDYDSGSLVQVERFARIDMNVLIRMNWEPIGIRTRAITDEIKKGELKEKAGPHVALGSISYPPLTEGGARETGALIYIKASMSGDEIDYVIAYKRANPDFPHETTMDQLFTEEQFEAYRALGEHIARRFLASRDSVAVYPDEAEQLLEIVNALLPQAAPP